MKQKTDKITHVA